MTSKKSRVLMSLGTTVLVLSLITSSMVGGTFAKYTSTVAGSDSARVAKFDFTVADSKDSTLKLNKEGTTVINLFDTVKDSGVYKDASGNNINTQKLVAPGVEGEFGLLVENKSEVAVKANLTITETTSTDGTTYVPNKTIPIVYAYTNSKGETTFWSDVIKSSDGSILLHQPTNTAGLQTAAASPATTLKDGTDNTLAKAKSGEIMVTISGDLKKLAETVNTEDATELMATNGTTITDDSKLNLSNNFKWFWAYEIYTSTTDSNGSTVYVPDTRDGVDTGLVWDADNNKAQANIPQIKVKLDVNITQIDTYTDPTPPAP